MKLKQINEHLNILKDFDERIHDLNEQEKVVCLTSINWILDNDKDILEAQILNVTIEHTDNIKFLKMMKTIMKD